MREIVRPVAAALSIACLAASMAIDAARQAILKAAATGRTISRMEVSSVGDGLKF